MNMSYKSKHEYAIYHEQDCSVLPFLEVRSCDFDPETFLVALASDWNSYFVLKPTLMQFSVFTFFTKIAKCVCDLGRSLEVLCTKVRF